MKKKVEKKMPYNIVHSLFTGLEFANNSGRMPHLLPPITHMGVFLGIEPEYSIALINEPQQFQLTKFNKMHKLLLH